MEDTPTSPAIVRALTTTALDLVGLLGVAIGVGWGSWHYLGGFAIAAGALVVLAGSAFATWRAAPQPQRSAHRSPSLWTKVKPFLRRPVKVDDTGVSVA